MLALPLVGLERANLVNCPLVATLDSAAGDRSWVLAAAARLIRLPDRAQPGSVGVHPAWSLDGRLRSSAEPSCDARSGSFRELVQQTARTDAARGKRSHDGVRRLPADRRAASGEKIKLRGARSVHLANPDHRLEAIGCRPAC